ncbi:hypothetical protein COT75_05480 [Candidatus Beckwithbacteria bacterium CG10_big_fil_rev_8_21_14_0_10_34_10]|uniref:ComEC/Rec2-related protein domain-containing protein n=1 Tax=Candidatus Beckwithbacteria bacterium CG10_big_fil_rev_8_21_14_0_10_34_10 TaxID=1974495 RepID=A0A2H0W9T6_9BACT|nr:MAG: hypothetical protein COT75_05480 [Candidatus Beckwithbacteria bacterium CG10_big_fil_rev_8_21_14_0_10_34_10]
MNLKVKYWFYFLLLFFGLYIFRLKAVLDIPFKAGDEIRIKAVLQKEPVVKGDKQSFKLKGITIQTDRFPEVHFGDKLEAQGILKTPKGTTFLPSFYLSYPKVSIRGETKKSISFFLVNFKNSLEKIIFSHLPQNQASLMAGILLGTKSGMEKNLFEALKKTGTLHIVVASGMNIALLAGPLLEFLSRVIKRRLAIFLALILVFCYALMLSFEPPILRAAIMASFFYLAQALGRESTGLWTLGLSLGLMLLVSPLLLFDLSFQLSGLATLGLMTLSSKLTKIFNKVKLLKPIAPDLGETLGAMVLTTPVIVFNFSFFNPLSIIPNLLILFLIPYLMILGIFICFSGLGSSFLASVFSFLAYIPLTYILGMIKLFSYI